MQHGSWSQPPSVFIIAGFSPCLKRLIPLHPGCQVCLNFSKLSPPLFSQHSWKKKAITKIAAFFFFFFFFFLLFPPPCLLCSRSSVHSALENKEHECSTEQNLITLVILPSSFFFVCDFFLTFLPLAYLQFSCHLLRPTSPFLFVNKHNHWQCARLFYSSSPSCVDGESSNHTYLKVLACHRLDLYVCIHAYNYMCNTVRPLFTFCKPAIHLPVGV